MCEGDLVPYTISMKTTVETISHMTHKPQESHTNQLFYIQTTPLSPVHTSSHFLSLSFSLSSPSVYSSLKCVCIYYYT